MIRKAKPSEINKIMLLTRACAAKMISNKIFQWNEHYPSEQAFNKDCKREELYVLILNNSIIGCITISTIKDKEYDAIKWLTKDATQFYIHRVAVHPEEQCKGYAKQLMDFAEDYAKKNNARSVRLDTFSANEQNQVFYEKRGYKRLGAIYFPKQSELPFYCYELVLS